MKRDWSLTSYAFANFLRLLDPIPAAADEKYEQIHRRLVNFFEWNWCADPDHAADVAIDRAIRKVEDGTAISNIYSYLLGIARLVLKEERKAARNALPLPIEVPAVEAEDQSYMEQRVTCLDQCLGKLNPEARDLFTAYYGEGTRDDLPAIYGATMNALRIRVFKVKSTLEHCLTSCIQGHPA
jgi:DNA-directed RNA polymerase specialized sigma24 family protein